LDYARYYAVDVVTYSTGPGVVVGSPHFLAGYALGTLVQRARLDRKAHQLAQPQWRYYGPHDTTVVTNHRLWCQVEDHWVNFDHDTITGCLHCCSPVHGHRGSRSPWPTCATGPTLLLASPVWRRSDRVARGARHASGQSQVLQEHGRMPRDSGGRRLAWCGPHLDAL
jgi:hypothetical protein